jgi:succinate dehydrogenase/fumarate reductase flavoprotein subunit
MKISGHSLGFSISGGRIAGEQAVEYIKRNKSKQKG